MELQARSRSFHMSDINILCVFITFCAHPGVCDFFLLPLPGAVQIALKSQPPLSRSTQLWTAAHCQWKVHACNTRFCLCLWLVKCSTTTWFPWVPHHISLLRPTPSPRVHSTAGYPQPHQQYHLPPIASSTPSATKQTTSTFTTNANISILIVNTVRRADVQDTPANMCPTHLA